MLMLISSLALLSGCKEKLKEGEIYSKEFIPSHTRLVVVPTIYSNGETSYTIVHTYLYYYPDSYRVDIRDYNEEREKYDTATYYVTEEVFEQCEIGNVFKYEEGRDFTEIPHTRKRK